MKALASAGNAGPRRVSGPFCAAAQVSYTRQTASKSAGVARRVRTPAGAPIRASAAAGTSTVS
jgi:hypothetical protein